MPAMRRRPANTAVIEPVPSLIITSRFGTPLRGATITRLTSPPTRTGTRRGASSIGVTSRPRQRSWRRVRSSSATEAPRRWRSDVRMDTRPTLTGRRSPPPAPRRRCRCTPARYPRVPVKSTLEPLEGNKVKLSVNVDEAEFDKDIDAAFRKIAREVRLPGFRAGKAPRRVLEARIGIAPAREQALRDSIPQYLAKAVREHDVDLIASPEVEITTGEEEGPIGFDATCEVRPEITVPGYDGLRVELPGAGGVRRGGRRGRAGAAPPPRSADRRRPAGGPRRQRHARPRRHPRRRGGPRAEHRGLDVRGRPGLGRRRLRRPARSAPPSATS